MAIRSKLRLVAVASAALLLPAVYFTAPASAVDSGSFAFASPSGPAGLSIVVRQVDPCPSLPPGWTGSVEMWTNDDGASAGGTALNSDGSWTGPIYVQTDPLSPPRTLTYGATCTIRNAQGQWDVTFNYAAQQYSIDSSAPAISIEPNPSPGSAVAISSSTPCPSGSTMLLVEFVTTTITDSTYFSFPVAQDGSWGTVRPAAPTAPDIVHVNLRCETAGHEDTLLYYYPASMSTQGNVASCRDVLFVGVRGSGETVTDGGGYGRAVDIVRDTFSSRLPASVSLREIALSYTAASTNELQIYKHGAWGVERYFASINDGIGALTTLLTNEIAACPKQRIVLSGYSQGALVINAVVRNASVRNSVGAVMLLGDPARVPSQIGRNLGDAKPGFGIYQLVQSKIPALPRDLSSRFAQVCDSGDVVCDWSHHGFFKAGVAVHTSYHTARIGILQAMGIFGVKSLGYTPAF